MEGFPPLEKGDFRGEAVLTEGGKATLWLSPLFTPFAK